MVDKGNGGDAASAADATAAAASSLSSQRPPQPPPPTLPSSKPVVDTVWKVAEWFRISEFDRLVSVSRSKKRGGKTSEADAWMSTTTTLTTRPEALDLEVLLLLLDRRPFFFCCCCYLLRLPPYSDSCRERGYSGSSLPLVLVADPSISPAQTSPKKTKKNRRAPLAPTTPSAPSSPPPPLPPLPPLISSPIPIRHAANHLCCCHLHSN